MWSSLISLALIEEMELGREMEGLRAWLIWSSCLLSTFEFSIGINLYVEQRIEFSYIVDKKTTISLSSSLGLSENPELAIFFFLGTQKSQRLQGKRRSYEQ